MNADPSARRAADRDPARGELRPATRRKTCFAGVALAVILLLAQTALPSPAVADEPRGSLGFALEIDGEGFFMNPTLKSVTVKSVVPSSPAARAGIAPQDRIVEADGHRVEGAKARDLEPLMKKRVGESLRLRLRRPGGDEYDATLVAVPRSP